MKSLTVELPTGRVVQLHPGKAFEPLPHDPAAGVPLFSEVRALFGSLVDLRDERGDALAVEALALVDFHTLRAIATHEGWLEEEDVPIDCVNCGAPMRVRPCAAMPIGPFVERALHDAELDARLAEKVAHEIPPVPLGSGAAVATTLTLRSIAAKEAEPLHRALAREPFALDAAVVRAMGIVSLGEETDPAVIAGALEAANDEAFDAVAALFIELHYPLRLFGVVRCEACGARNDVDAPFEREFGFGFEHTERADEPFVTFRAFARAARAIAKKTIAAEAESIIALVVEGGVAACDEGGIALLGSYMPASPGDAAHPSRGHEIAVYYRTFRAVWNEEGPFDWKSELAETIEHEYEHFRAELRGGDAVDEEERAEIAEEAIRIHGKSTLLRAEVTHFGSDLGQFLRRTWILWVVLILVALLLTFGQGPGSD